MSKTRAFILSLCCCFTQIHAQEWGPSPDPGATTPYALLSLPELEEVVAPIALYPDPLLGIVLPASTFPLQIVQAARFLRANEGATQPPSESDWESSVVALLNYPDVLFMMDEYLEWTAQLGDAVYFQQEDVMDAIQSVRQKAETAGHLDSNEKQVVVREREVIRIEPADPEVIYVPYYDPNLIFVEYVPIPYPIVSFSVGYHCGPWLAYSCDWFSHGIFANRFYFGGHWHSHSGRDYWRPPHRPRYRYDDRRDGHGRPDHHPGVGYRPHPPGRGEGTGTPGGPVRGDRPGRDYRFPEQNLQPHTRIDGQDRRPEKLPSFGIPPKGPPVNGRNGPSHIPDLRTGTRIEPRSGGWSPQSPAKLPNVPRYERKPGQTTLRIPSEPPSVPSNPSGYSRGSQFRGQWIQGKAPGSYKPVTQAPKTPFRANKPSVNTFSRPSKGPSASPMGSSGPKMGYGHGGGNGHFGGSKGR